VFVQSLALLIAQPIILNKSKIKEFGTRSLLKLFIPVTILSTPLGQLCAEYTSKKFIQTVGGFIVLGMAIFEIFRNRAMVKEALCSADAEGGEVENKSYSVPTSEETIEVVEVGEFATPVSTPAAEVESKPERPEVEMTTTIAAWALSMGFLSGFLGGLCGIRGPPLIIFFLHSPVDMPKNVQKANGAAITIFNVSMRVLFYAIEAFAGTGKHHFDAADWAIYLGVFVGSVSGVLVGQTMFERMKDKQAMLKTILSFFLLMCGLSLLVTAFWEA
jgi:uncharacterized membrane protein YfcA